MIATFENRHVLKNYLIVLIPIFDTMHKRKNQAVKYMWDLHHELVLFLQSTNCFCYVTDNDTKGDILDWTTSTTTDQNPEVIDWRGGSHPSKRPVMPEIGAAHPTSKPIAFPSTSLERVTGIAMKGINKYKLTKTLYQISPAPKSLLPLYLGNSAKRIAVRSNGVGFFNHS